MNRVYITCQTYTTYTRTHKQPHAPLHKDRLSRTQTNRVPPQMCNQKLALSLNHFPILSSQYTQDITHTSYYTKRAFTSMHMHMHMHMYMHP